MLNGVDPGAQRVLQTFAAVRVGGPGSPKGARLLDDRVDLLEGNSRVSTPLIRELIPPVVAILMKSAPPRTNRRVITEAGRRRRRRRQEFRAAAAARYETRPLRVIGQPRRLRENGQADEHARPRQHALLHRQLQPEIESAEIADGREAGLEHAAHGLRDAQHRQGRRRGAALRETARRARQVIMTVEQPRHHGHGPRVHHPRVERRASCHGSTAVIRPILDGDGRRHAGPVVRLRRSAFRL